MDKARLQKPAGNATESIANVRRAHPSNAKFKNCFPSKAEKGTVVNRTMHRADEPEDFEPVEVEVAALQQPKFVCRGPRAARGANLPDVSASWKCQKTFSQLK